MGMFHYTQIRESLVDLGSDFDELARYCAFLNHELLYAPEGAGDEPDAWSEEEFDRLKNSMIESPCWQQFVMSIECGQCSRFWSWDNCEWAVPTFTQFCDRGWQLLVAASQQDPSEMPKRFCVDGIQPRKGVAGAEEWLALLHETAFRFPTVDSHGNCRWRMFADKQCVSNVLSIGVVSASARLIDLIVAGDYVAELGRWECEKLEVELPAPMQDFHDESEALCVSVNIESEAITFRGKTFDLDQQLAAVMQCLIDANGERRSQSDMKKLWPKYCLDTRLDMTINRKLRPHKSGIGDFIKSNRSGFWLDVESLKSSEPEQQ